MKEGDLIKKAEGAIDSVFFTNVEEELKKSDGQIVSIDTSTNALGSGLTFSAGGQTERKLSFDKDSMAL